VCVCVCVCVLFLVIFISVSSAAVNVFAYRDLYETNTQPIKEQTLPDHLVHTRPCALSKYHYVCVCHVHTHRLLSHLKRCCLGDGVRRTGSSMITWQEKRGTLKEQRRETESTACCTLIITERERERERERYQ